MQNEAPPPPLQTVFDTVFSKAGRVFWKSRKTKRLQEILGWVAFYHPLQSLHYKRLQTLSEVIQAQFDELGRPLRVADLGCGGGILTMTAHLLGHRVVGLDENPEALELSQKLALELKTQAPLIQASFDDPHAHWTTQIQEVLGGLPDVVILGHVLSHLQNPDVFLNRLSQWLDHGAVLVLSEDNLDSPLFEKIVLRTKNKNNNYRNYDGWRLLLESKNFKVGPALGFDVVPLWGWFSPLTSWILIFAAHRR